MILSVNKCRLLHRILFCRETLEGVLDEVIGRGQESNDSNRSR